MYSVGEENYDGELVEIYVVYGDKSTIVMFGAISR